MDSSTKAAIGGGLTGLGLGVGSAIMDPKHALKDLLLRGLKGAALGGATGYGASKVGSIIEGDPEQDQDPNAYAKRGALGGGLVGGLAGGLGGALLHEMPKKIPIGGTTGAWLKSLVGRPGGMAKLAALGLVGGGLMGAYHGANESAAADIARNEREYQKRKLLEEMQHHV